MGSTLSCWRIFIELCPSFRLPNSIFSRYRLSKWSLARMLSYLLWRWGVSGKRAFTRQGELEQLGTWRQGVIPGWIHIIRDVVCLWLGILLTQLVGHLFEIALCYLKMSWIKSNTATAGAVGIKSISTTRGPLMWWSLFHNLLIDRSSAFGSTLIASHLMRWLNYLRRMPSWVLILMFGSKIFSASPVSWLAKYSNVSVIILIRSATPIYQNMESCYWDHLLQSSNSIVHSCQIKGDGIGDLQDPQLQSISHATTSSTNKALSEYTLWFSTQHLSSVLKATPSSKGPASTRRLKILLNISRYPITRLLHSKNSAPCTFWPGHSWCRLHLTSYILHLTFRNVPATYDTAAMLVTRSWFTTSLLSMNHCDHSGSHVCKARPHDEDT